MFRTSATSLSCRKRPLTFRLLPPRSPRLAWLLIEAETSLPDSLPAVASTCGQPAAAASGTLRDRKSRNGHSLFNALCSTALFKSSVQHCLLVLAAGGDMAAVAPMRGSSRPDNEVPLPPVGRRERPPRWRDTRLLVG